MILVEHISIQAGEFRLDDAYHYEFSNPKDGTISGSSEVFRHNEFQLTHLGIGGDFHTEHARGRLSPLWM